MSDEVQAPEAQVDPLDSVEIPEQTEGQAEPFMRFEAQDGEELSFASQEDAIKHFREGTLRHSDYTRKTQEAAEIRKRAEARERELETQMTGFMSTKAKYDKMDEFIRNRPDVARYITDQMRTPSPTAQADTMRGYADSQTQQVRAELKKLQDEIARDKQAKSYEEQKSKIFSNMGKKYQDFSQDEVMKVMKEIEEYNSLPSEVALENLAEMIYYANKGRGVPQQEKNQFIAEKLQKATVPMGGGIKPNVAKGNIGGDMDEVAHNLKKELGLVPS